MNLFIVTIEIFYDSKLKKLLLQHGACGEWQMIDV